MFTKHPWAPCSPRLGTIREAENLPPLHFWAPILTHPSVLRCFLQIPVRAAHLSEISFAYSCGEWERMRRRFLKKFPNAYGIFFLCNSNECADVTWPTGPWWNAGSDTLARIRQVPWRLARLWARLDFQCAQENENIRQLVNKQTQPPCLFPQTPHLPHSVQVAWSILGN